MSEKSSTITEADQLRDEDFQALREAIKPYRNSRRENEKAAYKTLDLLFDQYKKATKVSYEEESALLNSLLEKLRKAEYQSAIETLGIGRFMNNLTESQAAFEKVFSDRSQENLAKVSFDTKATAQGLGSSLPTTKRLCSYSSSVERRRYLPKDLICPQQQPQVLRRCLGTPQGQR